jgi:hypothetical protein
MKILSITTVAAAALLCFSSCSKQYNTTTSDSQTGNNGGGNQGANSFNWSGTAPLSAKVNGQPFLATSVDLQDLAGYYYIYGDAGDNWGMTPVVPKSALPGQIFSMPSPANVSYQWEDGSGLHVLGAQPGKVKVITNNATTLEGYFWADTKDVTGLSDTIVRITEGYFKIDK